MQSALIGLALAVFYLLLVLLSEHLPFTAACLVAPLVCAALIGIYPRGASGKKRLASAFSLGIGVLYAMLYSLLGSEDVAYIMSSFLVVAMLADVMISARRIDWYDPGTRDHPAETANSPNPATF